MAVSTLARLDALSAAAESPTCPLTWGLPPPPPALAPTKPRLAATACAALAALLNAPSYPLPAPPGAGGRERDGAKTGAAAAAAPSELVMVGWLRGGVGAPVAALKACVGDVPVRPSPTLRCPTASLRPLSLSYRSIPLC